MLDQYTTQQKAIAGLVLLAAAPLVIRYSQSALNMASNVLMKGHDMLPQPLRLGSIHMNGIHMNGIHMNGIHMNGAHMNGVAMGALAMRNNPVVYNGVHAMNGLHI